MAEYVESRQTPEVPRLPLEGSLDVTYRCNNSCRHCWVSIPRNSPEKRRELTLDEIRLVVDEAREMGCRRWSISGGEPMLRPDFPAIFDYITTRAVSYTLNTNGTLITPEIAKLLRRKGTKLVALYGANADVHDHITRNPGSFEATMQGIAYLKEAKAGFTVQLVPMRDNYHQFEEMTKLAEHLSPHHRVGAAWLHLSPYDDPQRNQEIVRQRLRPRDVVVLDEPDPSHEVLLDTQKDQGYHHGDKDGRLLASCAAGRREFHVDPYGRMTFCSFIKDPSLRYDLRKGSFKEGWENFIPSLAGRVTGGEEYLENCGSCDLRSDCRWCPVYGFLEHGRFSAKVKYLCAVASEKKRYKEEWQKKHRRYYRIAGITIRLDSDLPMTDSTFHAKFKRFRVDGPEEDTISLRHRFFLPNLVDRNLGQEVHRRPPWIIYRKGRSWIYVGASSPGEVERTRQMAVFNRDYTRGTIYNRTDEVFARGGLAALTLFPTDQLVIAQVLADREGCYFHSSGVIFDGMGLLFAGHSEAGKSTVVKMLREKAEILCDDRVVVRRWPEGFRIHGTWSHGEVPDVSPNSAPLRAILFLEQARENRVIRLTNRREMLSKLLACLIRPFLTADWWQKTLSLMGRLADEIPCYSLRFDKSGKVVGVLEQLRAGSPPRALVATSPNDLSDDDRTRPWPPKRAGIRPLG